MISSPNPKSIGSVIIAEGFSQTKGNLMENRKYPRYKVVDQDGKPIGIAVCNLETEAPQEQKTMEDGQYPRYEVVDQDGKLVGIAVCNLELE